MAAKRTGLGRGIGALIPTIAESGTTGRPVDVFFPGAPTAAAERTSTTAKGATKAAARDATASAPAKRAASKRSAQSAASISDAPADAATAAAAAAEGSDGELLAVEGLRLIDVSPAQVQPNPRQPRTNFDADDLAELVHSVREFGVLQPVVVRPLDAEAGTYELIMGERRLRASREAGLATIPAIVRETEDEFLLRDALLENLHRSQLNPLEEASAYQQLLSDFGITQEELAARIGRSRPQISNTIRLLKLPVPVQQRVAAGVLSAGHARALLTLEDEVSMQHLADKIVSEDLSVRAAEAVAAGSPARRVAPKAGTRRGHLDEIAEHLGDRLDTRVKISLTAKKGQITIDFATVGDLNRILGILGEPGYGG
ncbi:MAG: ParB/RepB/Spo0J family partition protein [Microbacteriaceae bacterium]|nr:ParB/RepB/Spo0J family partition protein [Microbacteriaceae bacterium]